MQNKFLIMLQPLWMQLREQWQANQRLRWLVWSVVYIVLFYVGLVLNDWRQLHNEAVAQLQRTSVKLDQLQHQTQWSERWQHEQVVGEKLRAKLWEAQSDNLAEADLQNFLRKIMTGHGMQNYRPRLAPTERVSLGGESVIKVTAEVSGVVAVGQIDHLMKALADNPKSLSIERFNYNPQAGGQLTMHIVAYFLVAKSSEAVSSADSLSGGADAVR
jgi:hypothetical protein